jgi:nitroimidazol reductase NimA-like FMN-containing flavoprotein (pyridoxamine 5'-phosphate oxidase superfamily)
MTEASLEQLGYDECVERLREGRVGRIAVLLEGFPIVLPVNFRLVETGAGKWLAIRTRAGNVVERAPLPAAFEIDDVDFVHRGGWSVLVQGTLHHVDPDAADFRTRFDPEPWLGAERNAWMVIDPFSITGRRLRPGETEWVFARGTYL